MKTDNWDNPELKDGDWVKTAGQLRLGEYCDAKHKYDGWEWTCSRPTNHDGQHVATAGVQDGYEDVCAVWPR